MTSTDQSHDQYAATAIEAFDRGEGTIGNLTICNWLLQRCTRRLREAHDRTLRLFYTDGVHSLRDSFRQMCAGEMGLPDDRAREIMRKFARFSCTKG